MVFGRAAAKWSSDIPFPLLKWSQASGGKNENGISRGFGNWVRCLEGHRGSKQPLSTRSKDFEVYRESPVDRIHSLVVGDAEGG
ncbi:hypothetical protein RHGRI_013328 [Rhododendron griersonianum]|uniref:Uncharacterized protein n=1 Tax=Rhododendron griersonianum TaxID=479676 RepID=A0AAV6K587_9ERIC|nr:hypothetical protein RHGRI_013328 [Rhododendron griersonianum]